MRRNRSDDTETDSTGWLDRSRGSMPEPGPASSSGLLSRIPGRSDDSSATGSQGSSTGSRGVLDRVRGGSTEPATDDSGSWFGRAKAKYGLGTLLVAAGVVLFLFPEPVTSTAGIVLMAAGVVLWLLG